MASQHDHVEPGEGNVTITWFNGEERELVPCRQAFVILSRRFGGLRQTMTRIMDLDVEAISAVVAMGLGYFNNTKLPKDWDDQLYATGLTDDTGGLQGAAMEYCASLSRGGRAAPEDNKSKTGEEEEEGSAANPSK